MSPAHLHLMLNHLPVVGTPIVLALLLWGLLRRSRDVQRAALGAVVLLAVVSYPVFLTGEPAEEQLEDSTWYQERLVHEHEERGEAALIAMLLTGGIAVVGLWQSRGSRPAAPALGGITAGGLALSAALFGWTALAGGVIRHEEVRPGPAALAPGGDGGQAATGGGQHAGDDD